MIFSFYNRFNACIVYDKEKANILSWGDIDFEKDNEDHIRVNGFLDGISRIFKKNKENWDDDDKFFLKAVSDFLRMVMVKREEEFGFEENEKKDFHHAFIVPSEWEKGIREEIVRPIFIEAGLILKNDHKDRLLFFSDIECICYDLQAREDSVDVFKRGRNTLFCRFSSLDVDKALIKLDLVQTTISLFNFPDSKFFPKVIRSNSISVNEIDVINCIKLFLNESCLSTIGDDLIEILADEIFNYESCILATYNKDDEPLKSNVIMDTSKWELDESQASFVKSIRICDICQNFGTELLNNMKDIVSNNFAKEYRLLLADDQYSCETNSSEPLYRWIDYLLEYNRQKLNEVATVTRSNFYSKLIEQNNIVSGAGYIVMEIVQCSYMQCPPRIVSTCNMETSRSVFQNSKPDAILDINISIKSTILSFSLLDSNGMTEKIFDHKYLTADQCMPSLERFYSFSDTVHLKVTKKFIEFTEKYMLLESNNYFIKGCTPTEKEEMMTEIKNILSNSLTIDEAVLCVEQPIYIQAFLLMYIFYIRELILHKLSTELSLDYDNMKIGFAVTIEKALLYFITDTEEKFRELILSNNLVQKNDGSKILRIMTQEETLLPVIQHSLKLDFPIKSYFILAQLYDDYIQLTLNQVVVAFESESKCQESIIFENEIIPVTNIYEFLCMNMWNSIIQKRQLVELCDIHKDNDDFEILNLFSLRNKTEFLSHFKNYISNQIFDENANIHQKDKNTIRLSNSCSCNVCFTVNDIIEICLKPVLQEITVTVLTSLINTDFFEIYTDIDYIFNLVYFSNNPQLQTVITNIMIEEAESFNPRHGIDAVFLVVSQLPSQLLHPVLNENLLLFEEFQLGILQQVFTRNYAVLIRPKDMDEKKYVCKNKITDIDGIKLDKFTAIYLCKKGDIIRNTGFRKVIYIKEDEMIESLDLTLAFFDYEDFEDDGLPYYAVDDGDTFLGDFEITLELNNLNSKDGLPIMICVDFQSYSSSLVFSACVIGDGSETSCFVEIGELMVLDRF